jgi:predicted small secreted protein
MRRPGQLLRSTAQPFGLRDGCAAWNRFRAGAFEPYQQGEWTMKFLLTVAIASLTIFVASCNTIAGAGRDTQRAGEAVEDAAEGNS